MTEIEIPSTLLSYNGMFGNILTPHMHHWFITNHMRYRIDERLFGRCGRIRSYRYFLIMSAVAAAKFKLRWCAEIPKRIHPTHYTFGK